ncbi:hypothetical protein [Nonomuraea sp. NPDC049129]|uniref:hypothetical protein n=1 Tax=Nonomuraea sp. NPDC049129 TaxID=3155272 RepID=UPI0033E9C021
MRRILLGGVEGVAAVLACYTAAWHVRARLWRSRPSAESRLGLFLVPVVGD